MPMESVVSAFIYLFIAVRFFEVKVGIIANVFSAIKMKQS